MDLGFRGTGAVLVGLVLVRGLGKLRPLYHVIIRAQEEYTGKYTVIGSRRRRSYKRHRLNSDG